MLDHTMRMIGAVCEGKVDRDDYNRLHSRLSERSSRSRSSFYKEAIQALDYTYSDEMIDRVEREVYRMNSEDARVLVELLDHRDFVDASDLMRDYVMANPRASMGFEAGAVMGYTNTAQFTSMHDFSSLLFDVVGGHWHDGRLRETFVVRGEDKEGVRKFKSLTHRQKRIILSSWRAFDRMLDDGIDPTDVNQLDQSMK